MNEAKTISVVMAASDFYAHTPELFQSLDAQVTDDFHTVVVDDGSSEGCDLRAHDRAMVLRNMKRLGFSRALNQALLLTLTKWEGEDLEHKYICLIQPDIILHEEALVRLRQALEDQPGLMVVAPTILRAARAKGIEEEWELAFSDDILYRGFAITKSREIRWMKEGQLNFAPAPDCFMVRASLLLKLQEGKTIVDESFRRIPALIELLWRIKLYGGRMACIPDALAWKQQAQSSETKLRDEIQYDKSTRLELHDVHVKLSPNTLRMRQAPWLFIGWIKRFFLVLFAPSLWGAYLHKPMRHFRVAKQRSKRFARAGMRSAQMKDWFV